jgi:tetratricopeptide (TPR) repeat protein
VAAVWSLPLGLQSEHVAFEEQIGWWARYITSTCIQVKTCPVDPLGLVTLEERAVRAFPNTPNCHANLGAALYRARKYPEALSQLLRAGELQKGKFSPWHLLFLGMTHHQLGHAKEANQWLKKALEENQKQKGSYDWQERLLFDRLHAEARALIQSP